MWFSSVSILRYCYLSKLLTLKRWFLPSWDFEYVQRCFLPFRGLSYTQSCTSNIHSEIQSWKVAENLPEKVLAWRPWASHRRFYEPLEIQHIPSFINECELVFSGERNLIFHQIFRDFYPAHQKKKITVLYHIFKLFLTIQHRKRYILHHESAHSYRLSWNQVFVRLF